MQPNAWQQQKVVIKVKKPIFVAIMHGLRNSIWNYSLLIYAWVYYLAKFWTGTQHPTNFSSINSKLIILGHWISCPRRFSSVVRTPPSLFWKFEFRIFSIIVSWKYPRNLYPNKKNFVSYLRGPWKSKL
jgi:hypothetical protein